MLHSVCGHSPQRTRHDSWLHCQTCDPVNGRNHRLWLHTVIHSCTQAAGVLTRNFYWEPKAHSKLIPKQEKTKTLPKPKKLYTIIQTRNIRKLYMTEYAWCNFCIQIFSIWHEYRLISCLVLHQLLFSNVHILKNCLVPL